MERTINLQELKDQVLFLEGMKQGVIWSVNTIDKQMKSEEVPQPKE